MAFLLPMMEVIGICGNMMALCIVFLLLVPAVPRPSGAVLKTCAGTYMGLCMFAVILLLSRATGKMSMWAFWHHLAFADGRGGDIMSKAKRKKLEKAAIEIVAGSMEYIGEYDRICEEAANLTDSELLEFLNKFSDIEQ